MLRAMALRSVTQHLGHLPLFPLPEALLFPTMRMPLHIFEPRYRQLVRDARSDQLPIAIGHIKKSSHATGGVVPVYPVVGAGFIDEIEELPDGRFMIVLVGEARVQIVTEKTTTQPYRVVVGERLVDCVTSSEQNRTALQGLRRMILALHQTEPRVASALTGAIGERTSAGDVANVLGSLLHAEPQLRQSWLEEVNPVARLQAVTEALGTFMAERSEGRLTLN